MSNPSVPTPPPDGNPGGRIAEAILNLLGHIPETDEHKSRNPAKRARSVAHGAATKAALAAGTLALPPGPLGWLTILPELIAVWKIQAQMVADIAALYGRKASLTREQMLYCLFRHMAAQAVRDVVVRVGERFMVRRLSLRTLQSAAQKVGLRVSQRAIGKGFSRWLPVVGALGVATYAFIDTGQVAAAAIELFEREIEIEPEPGDSSAANQKAE